MSRSYRKHLILTDSSTNHRYHPTAKEIANRRTRRVLRQKLTDDMWRDNTGHDVFNVNHNKYRKLTESWDIYDYKARFNKRYDHGILPFWKWRRK